MSSLCRRQRISATERERNVLTGNGFARGAMAAGIISTTAFDAKAFANNRPGRSPGFHLRCGAFSGLAAQWHSTVRSNGDLQLRDSSRFARDSLLASLFRGGTSAAITFQSPVAMHATLMYDACFAAANIRLFRQCGKKSFTTPPAVPG